MKKSDNNKRQMDSEYATFYLKDALCGIALSKIQEINRPAALTVVPQAPDYVMGVINLRGKIVTVIDTGKLLGLSPIAKDDQMRTIIVTDGGESFGLMVDRIGNVVTVDPGEVDPPPANVGDLPGNCFDSVYKTDDQLVGLLSLRSIV
jgi:purine-binding chemotaxis protein CheW